MLKHVAPVLSYPVVILQHQGLIWNFFRRELLGRFHGSFLGIFWVLVQPMIMFAIYYMVFGYLFGPKAAPGAGPDKAFAMYLFSGIIAFTAFSEATVRCCNVVLENGNLVKKVAFPCELLPVPHVMVATMVYLVGAAVLISVGLSIGGINLDWNLLALPLLLWVHITFSLGVGLFLAALQVFMRDASHIYGILMQAMFFLSPVFWWPEIMLSKEAIKPFFPIFQSNPVYPLLMAHRQVLGVGEHVPGSLWYHLGLAAIWALVLLVGGYSFFMSRKNKFADLV